MVCFDRFDMERPNNKMYRKCALFAIKNAVWSLVTQYHCYLDPSFIVPTGRIAIHG